MVFDRILSGIRALKNPWLVFFAGFVFASIAILLSQLVFPAYSSLVMVFLTVMVLVPLTYSIAKLEFDKDLAMDDLGSMLAEHRHAVAAYTYLFLGVTFCFVLWYVFMPAHSTESLFRVQAETINQVNSPAHSVTGGFGSANALFRIFFNNFRVLFFSILFSLIYGVGFIFIVVWNASVIGAAIGNVIRVSLAKAASSLGYIGFSSYLSVFSLGVLRYLVHGTAEIAAYIIAGFAGSVVSIYIVKKGFKLEHAFKVIVDVADLLLVSVLLLFIAAILEVYVTPRLFL